MVESAAAWQAVAEEAADWLVRLDSDDPGESAAAQAGFDAWKSRDPRNAQAATDMAQLLQRMQGLRQEGPAAGQAMRQVLATGRAARRRRGLRAGGSLVLLLALTVPAWLAVQGTADLPGLLSRADIRSSEGQWLQQVLSDGSQLTLSGAGAVRLHFDAGQRVVELLRGSVLVDVAHDAGRPFYVQTTLGRVRALGTRFTVTLDGDGMRVEMLESRVAVQSGQGDSVELRAGQRTTVAATGIGRIEPLDRSGVESGWQRHQLVVDNRPLAEVLDQLARHHQGSLRFDRAALADLRMTGVLPLDDSARALQLLQQLFPQLQVRSFASRWVWVERAPAY